MTNLRNHPDTASLQEDDDKPTTNSIDITGDDYESDSEPEPESGQRTRRYFDTSPRTPRRQRRHAENLRMELEVPLEIARSSQITWTITPHSTPSSTRNPDPSPLRAGSIPAPDFGPAPFVSQASCNFQANADVFTEPIAPGTLNSPSKHKPPPASTDKPATSRPRAARTMSPDQPPFTQPRPGFATHHARGTFGQDQFSAVDGFNNETHGIDPNWPVPAYPCQDGERHPDEPLPNIPVHPKRYYVIFKGLRPGVYYDVWKPLEILCKGLKGGVGEWKKYPTYRRAVLEFEKGDIAVIPNIGYW